MKQDNTQNYNAKLYVTMAAKSRSIFALTPENSRSFQGVLSTNHFRFLFVNRFQLRAQVKFLSRCHQQQILVISHNHSQEKYFRIPSYSYKKVTLIRRKGHFCDHVLGFVHT